jgi:hypothetical protein
MLAYALTAKAGTIASRLYKVKVAEAHRYQSFEMLLVCTATLIALIQSDRHFKECCKLKVDRLSRTGNVYLEALHDI